MGLPNVMNTGRSGMMAAKTAISTAGHNISNANTEGYSRQKTNFKTARTLDKVGERHVIGKGVDVESVDRVNDKYLEKQLREGGKVLSHLEEKDLVYHQIEDIFNEMNGDGLNRLMSRFFNDFRQLANDPDNEAVRQSVRESAQAMIKDMNRLRTETKEVGRHIDSRLTGLVRETNALAEEIKDLNLKIKGLMASGSSPNDLLDQRDLALKKLGSYLDISTHEDEQGAVYVDIKGVGPLVSGVQTEKFSVHRSPADGEGKPENALDLVTTSTANSVVTHQIKGGKFGALLEVRDDTLNGIYDRLDDLAYTITEAVNRVHEQGYTRSGMKGVKFFKTLPQKHRAAEYIQLSDDINRDANNIAAAAAPNAPGDNRIAVAIGKIQGLRVMGDGTTTIDDWYNGIVSDVGVANSRNRSALNQQKNIVNQMSSIRDQISGVSIDEETANLLQFQHVFDASAKVIQVANEMLDTVLNIKRM